MNTYWLLVAAALAGCATGGADDAGTSEPASEPDREAAVLEAVQWYYDAFSSKSFAGAEEFMTEDFDNINPSGEWTRSREAALGEYAALLSSILAGVVFTHDDTAIWFGADDIAFAATTAHLSAYVAFDGTKHENDSNRVSIVLVKRGGRWRLMHVQNTPL